MGKRVLEPFADDFEHISEPLLLFRFSLLSKTFPSPMIIPVYLDVFRALYK